MRRTFPLHDLGDEEFETLVAAICDKILGTGTIVFAPGRDGGRDATFSGIAQNYPSTSSPLKGQFVIQAKHTRNPAASCSDIEFDTALVGEHPKIKKLYEDGELDHYLLFTNRKKPATKSIAKEKAIKKLGVKTAQILGLEQIRA